ncbi:MAG: T9SS type A sorting domain-containing protein [Ignavibacteria bacterium]|nr:T9SS type A sorting domain-containing protein [Ignavibacteria bacterium]
MRSFFKILALLLLISFIQFSNLLSAPGFKIERSVVGSGGMLELKNLSNLRLSGIFGQVAIDRISKADKILYQGFWVPTESPTDVTEPISLNQQISNFPNPASTSTTFRYTLDENSLVTLKIYDMVGNLVKVLVDGFQPAGKQEVVWDLKNDSQIDVPSGNYFYELTVTSGQVAGFNESKTQTYRNILVIVK